jgi:signal transduction histidine kinase
MTVRQLLIVTSLLVMMILAAGCIQSPQPAQTATPSPTGATPTPGVSALPPPPVNVTNTTDLFAFVRRAATYARENGKAKAIASFNDPNGSFVAGTLYIFAEDYNGTALAEPLEPAIVGTNISGMTDSFGTPLVRNLQETARFGRGFVSYAYPNPGKNATVESKLSVVEDVDGTYYVGAGIYASDADIYPSVVLNLSGKQPGVDDLVTYVRNATAYARANGREKALAVFNDSKGAYVQGQLAVMAFDMNGTNLAAPPYAADVAANRINLINYQDPDGVDTIRGMRDIANTGGGFLYTVARVTVDGKDVYLPKIDYAEPVDKNWWLFAGIIDPAYTGVVTGNLTGLPVRKTTRTNVYDLVNEAVAYAQANGKEKALAAIDDPHGPFVRGNLSVWAESTDGTVLADPYWKTGIGQNFIDDFDRYGMNTTKVGIGAMQNGTGFSHALFPDTSVNGTTQIPKLIFQKAVDESWWIGSGVYGVEVR